MRPAGETLRRLRARLHGGSPARTDPGFEVLLLFRLLLERAPGPKELQTFVTGLAEGQPTAWAVDRLVQKAEYADRLGADDPFDVVCRRALDRPATATERGGGLDALVAALLADERVRGRFSVAELDAPRGIDPTDPAAYRAWLDHHRSWREAVGAATDEDVLTVIHTDEPWATAMERATGRFVTLLLPGQQLEPDVEAWLTPHLDAEVLLTDGDLLDADGLPRDPDLGAAWDPDRALVAPPAGVVAVRRERAARCDPDPATGAWNLLLQATRGLDAAAVRRVPGVLLHTPADALPTTEAARELVAAHTDGAVEEVGPGPLLRVRHPLPAPPTVTVIVPTRDRADLLERCLVGLLDRTDYPALEVLVLDNDSVEPQTAELFARRRGDPRLRVVPQPGPFNWSAFNNRGVMLARGEVVVLLNNDAEPLDADWLTELVSQALRPDVGVVGAKLLYEDGTVQHAGMSIGPEARTPHLWRFEPGDAPGPAGVLSTVRTVGAVTGACMAFRRSVFDEVGGLQETDLKVTYSDVDLCLRLRAAGYRVVWTPHARLTHIANATRDTTSAEEKPRVARERDYLVRTWGPWADADPHLSPFLVNRDGPPLLAWRPRRPPPAATPHV